MDNTTISLEKRFLEIYVDPYLEKCAFSSRAAYIRYLCRKASGENKTKPTTLIQNEEIPSEN